MKRRPGLEAIEPFRVMAILARAQALAASGRDIVHMEVGEPDFITPAPIIAAGQAALAKGLTHYTPALGLPALRRAIADDYAARYDSQVDWQQVVVTPGASGALLLVLSALVEPGAAVYLPDPGYPCNLNMVRLLGGVPRPLPVTPAQGFKLLPSDLATIPAGSLVMLASPANPTGVTYTAQELAELAQQAARRDAVLIVDEIYQGLNYESSAQTVLTQTDKVIVINSFSKFFGMTGWRVGWLVAPAELIPDLDKLAQNIFLAAPTLAQHAALAAFAEETLAILEQRRQEFARRRDFLLPALRDLGFAIPVNPQGAFYLYANSSRFSADSEQFCADCLERCGVAITPGTDFGHYQASSHVRFAYTTAMERLQLGVQRLRDYLN